MDIYIVQHAQSKPSEQDPTRPLSEEGLSNIERVAAHAARFRLSVDHIYHSGKLRAKQTAETGKGFHLYLKRPKANSRLHHWTRKIQGSYRCSGPRELCYLSAKFAAIRKNVPLGGARQRSAVRQRSIRGWSRT